MRLYLSSYRLGDRPADLLALMRGGRRAIVISNALDAIPRGVRVMYEATVYDQRAAFAAIGVDADHLDLRAYFGHQAGLRERLAANDLVWVTGGNSFLLMRAMVQSGFIPLIREMLARDRIVYGGYSAGAVVATPSLRGIDLMDAPHEIAESYEPAAIWDGMGLVDFSIVPHYRSNHPESPLAEKVTDYLTASKTKFITLRDGEVFIRDDG
jgi:dipeptidase E